MNVRFAKLVPMLLALALAWPAVLAHAQQKKGKWDGPAAEKDKPDNQMADDKPAAASTGGGKEMPKKIYRFKSEKKGSAGGAQMMMLLVEDVFTNKSETFYVPNNDPASKEYDPLTDVATVVKDMDPGTAIEIETEKVKGRALVKSVAKADVKPGEELPNGFVFVDQRDMGKENMPNVVVTLSKFGREIKATVPNWKDKNSSDAKWAPDPKIDRVVSRMQSGMVVEAIIKPGKTPTITEMYEWRPPERGTFVESKPVDFGKGKAMGFEITGYDGTAITFTLEGTEQSKNGETVYIPNPQQMSMVKKFKKDTPVEVRYRLEGRTWVLRAIRPLGPNEKITASSWKPEMDEKMKPAKGKEMTDTPENEMGDKEKTPEKGAEKAKGKKNDKPAKA